LHRSSGARLHFDKRSNARAECNSERQYAAPAEKHNVKRDHADDVIDRWRVELPDIADVPLEITKRAARLSAMLDATAHTQLSRLGLTRADYEVLATLRRVGAPYRLRPAELASELLLSSGGTSNVVRRLSELGYVTRAANSADGRSSWVQLTDTGVIKAERAVRAAVSAQSDLLRPIPKRTMRTLAHLLRDVLVELGDAAIEIDEPDIITQVS
jgi:DNA-binding MarR family transcriptional regulator